jgi:hypothetical protein
VIYDPSCRLDVGLTSTPYAAAAATVTAVTLPVCCFGCGVATSDVLNLQRPIFSSWWDDVGNLRKESLSEDHNDTKLTKISKHICYELNRELTTHSEYFMFKTAVWFTKMLSILMFPPRWIIL